MSTTPFSSTNGFSTTGNVTANYFAGNGSLLTNLPATTSNLIANGTSNVSIPTADSSVTFNVAGSNAGAIGTATVSLGTGAGVGQGTQTVAIGVGAGNTSQTQRAVAIGASAGGSNQGLAAVAVGRNAGGTTQGQNAVAVGQASGTGTQGQSSVAVGSLAGSQSQGQFSVAVGPSAGTTSQGNNAVAIGRTAGGNTQGANAIAIGYNAGGGSSTAQPAGSIAIIATGVDNVPVNAGFYVDPVRNDTANVSNAVYYNTSTKEVTYSAPGPAFSAYANATQQTIPSGVQTKVLFQTEEFDTNSNFANSTFTPTTAGYYQLNAQVRVDGNIGTGETMLVIWKNGAEYKRGWNASGSTWASTFGAMTVSSLVQANGTSDYFEIYIQQTSGNSLDLLTANAQNITWFNGCMLRGS